LRTLINAITVIVVIVLCSFCATAQQTNSTARTKETVDEALRDKAFDLIESLAGQLSTLQSTENRARIGSNIAESIWNHDEKRARQLFALVQDDIKSGMNPPTDYNPINSRTFLVFLKLRADTIERIARHDPELAYAFFKATQLDANAHIRYEFRNNEHELEMHLAKKVASSSPDLALELGRKAFAHGFPQDLRVLLSQLNKKHKEEALVLYKEIVQKLSEADFAENWEARNFAVTLALTFPAPDDSAFRELINIFIKAGVANGCTKKTSDEDQYHEDVCQAVGRVLQHIAKIDPRRAAQLKRWAPEREEYIEGEYPSASYYELDEVAEDGTVEEILALAPRHPELEEAIYWRAAIKARTDGDFERARKIISDYRGDAEKRKVMLARLDEDQARLAVSEERLTEVLKGISEIQQPLARVSTLLTLANNAGVTDHKIALKLLDQASEIVKTLKPGREEDEAQVRLAFLYCLERSDRGMAIVESLIPKLNEVVAAAIKLDGYDTQYVREGEWNMSAEGSIGSLLTLLATGSGYFAWYDFDRAVSLAGQFERNEIRMMAQLKLAQSILSGPPKRIQFGW
jgi:hypothetical protein